MVLWHDFWSSPWVNWNNSKNDVRKTWPRKKGQELKLSSRRSRTSIPPSLFYLRDQRSEHIQFGRCPKLNPVFRFRRQNVFQTFPAIVCATYLAFNPRYWWHGIAWHNIRPALTGPVTCITWKLEHSAPIVNTGQQLCCSKSSSITGMQIKTKFSVD